MKSRDTLSNLADLEHSAVTSDKYGVVEMGLFREGKFPTSPKQLEIVKINPILASKLNEIWHSRLPVIHWSNIVRNRYYICYATLFDWRYFSVAIWSSPVARNIDPNSNLELRRMAISAEAPKFTATWMLGKMHKLIRAEFPTIERLISYQDTEVHKGTIYKAANWAAVYETKADSWIRECRDRNEPQAVSNKIRWEYIIRGHHFSALSHARKSSSGTTSSTSTAPTRKPPLPPL